MHSITFFHLERRTFTLKIAINAWAFPNEYSFEDCLAAAKNAGFEAIEFNVDAVGRSEHSFTIHSTDEEILAVGELVKKYGLVVPSISSDQSAGKWPLCDEESRQFLFAVTEKQLRVAKLLGADTILTVPGGMQNGMLLSESRANSIKNMRDFLPVIEKYGVKVGVENVGNTFFLSPYDVLSFIEEVGSDMVGSYLDLGNMFSFSDPIHWIDIIGDKIFKIHVKDYKRTSTVNKGGAYVQLLEGDIDFKRCMQLLKKVGFDGYLTAEFGRLHPGISDEDYINSIAASDKIIKSYYDEASR